MSIVYNMSLTKNVKYDNPFGVLIEEEELLYISSEVAFDNEIMEAILDCVKKENDLRISSLLKESVKRLSYFKIFKKNKFKLFRYAN